MSTALTQRQIWTIPIVLAVASTIGLVSALIGDGVWDVLSWVALGMPIAVILRHVVQHRLGVRL